LKNKSIKKPLKILVIFFSAIIFLLIAFLLFIQVTRAQTYLAHKAANYFSEKLHTRVEVKSVDIEFFKTLVLEGVFIEDLHHDTLLYSKKLKLDIADFNLETHQLKIRQIDLISTTAKLIQYKSETVFNYQFIIDAFASADTTNKKNTSPWDIQFENVELKNIDFTLRDQNETDTVEYGINYFDLRANAVNGEFTDISFDKDTIIGNIINLSVKEKSGFILNNLSSHVKVSPVAIQLNGLKIKTPNSFISTNLIFKYKRYQDFNDFNNLVFFKAEFKHSELELNDISYFAGTLKGLTKKITISGKVSGKVSDLKAKSMNIALDGTTTVFKGDIILAGLPNIDETSIYLTIKQLKTNFNDLKLLPSYPFDAGKHIDIPTSIEKLGDINFKGMFTGLYNDFYAYGKLSSLIGDLSLDLSMGYDQRKKQEKYEGKLKSTAFNIGEFLDAKLIGKATADVVINGYGLTLETINASLKGTLSSLDFKDYTYKNIQVEGEVAKKVFKGKLNVKDDNVDFDFDGEVNYSKSVPEFNFISSINKANLSALHFVKSDKPTNFSTHLSVDVTGNTIDNMIGEISFDNTVYKEGVNNYTSSVLCLVSKMKQNKKSVTLLSDFAEAEITGDYKILELPVSLEKLMSNYLPEYFDNTIKYQKIAPQIFDYEITFKNMDAVTRLWIPILTISPFTKISGNFNSSSNNFSLEGKSTKLNVGGLVLKNWNTQIKTNHQLSFNTGCETLYLTDSTCFKAFNINGTAQNDTVNWGVNWNNNSVKQNKGNIAGVAHFEPKDIIKLLILPSQLVFEDSIWDINMQQEASIDRSLFIINNLIVDHNEQSIHLGGVVSENKDDQLKLTFHNFNLANINFFTQPVGLTLKGTIEGVSTISDVYHEPLFLSKNTFKSLFINDSKMGDGDVQTVWDNTKEALSLNGSFTYGIVPNFVFSGFYYPAKTENNLDMNVNLEAIQLKLFQPFVKDYCSDFAGHIAGNISINGSLKQPLLSGFLDVNAKQITISYLKTTYRFSHKIIITNNSFEVKDMDVYVTSNSNSKAIINGKIHHRNFKDFQLNIDINAQKLMALNTTEVDNTLFYGKAYLSGNIDISGSIDKMVIDANVKTESISLADKSDKINLLSTTDHTKFYIPLTSQSELGENDFISFIKKDNIINVDKDYESQLEGLTMNFDLEVTPDAEVQLIFDQRVGDIIKSKGSGNIKLNIDTKGEFKMFGNYVIDKGDYLFTLKNVINKKFDIEKGGTVKWTGIPYKADLNVTALYKTRALLSPFFDSITKGNLDLKKRYPVDLKLLLTGNLLEPVINFGLDIPTVNASARQTILGYLNTDAEINRQVVPLLLGSFFISPTQLNNASTSPTIAGGAASSAVEMLSNQLNNMLGNVSKEYVNVGVNYRAGNAVSKEQLDLAISTQLFDNKLSIDGNLGTNSNNTTTSNGNSSNNIVGDVNIDYKLTSDGKARVKAFNKTNNNVQLNSNGLYTQGVGVFYREEFDSIAELRRRYRKFVKRKK
jgi:hypothetical protein